MKNLERLRDFSLQLLQNVKSLISRAIVDEKKFDWMWARRLLMSKVQELGHRKTKLLVEARNNDSERMFEASSGGASRVRMKSNGEEEEKMEVCVEVGK